MSLLKIASLLVVVLIAISGYFINKAVLQPPPLPTLEETWWGHGDPWREEKTIRPFRVNVSDKDLLDLKYRLDHARSFTPPLEGIAQQYGMNTNLLKEVVEFWKNKYDWRAREKDFNRFPQFLTSIQGLDIHYLHIKPKLTASNVRVLPLLIVHGWPGSVVEFFNLIPLLTTPAPGRDFVFELIIPAIPGYGFSQAAVRPGLGAAQIAVVFNNLMTKRLGFKQYFTQGGDFGTLILDNQAKLFPGNVLGHHSNMCVITTPLAYLKTLVGALYPSWFTKEDHVNRVYPLNEKMAQRIRETGYLHLQATKPDTLGVGLRDSPVGLAAYMLEKFVTGANYTFQLREDGGLKEVFGYTELLDNIMVYWITGSMPTAMRLYAETFNKAHMGLGLSRIPFAIPTACARFTNDFYSSDGILREIHQNLVHLADYHAGHFAALQVPDVIAKDIFIAVQKFEAFNAQKASK